ncbi:hypothetical protein BpHYR1_000655 [Brachionus plicatilis]|uniref:Uncharacterized protein n=1 Tax=Brachionus plicatilis TaxID=10195 RepID=A0A3M7SGX2_BRAPC|nr:hypothetical protein BpHYR1_000655 [Brachionus plicatilis]
MVDWATRAWQTPNQCHQLIHFFQAHLKEHCCPIIRPHSMIRLYQNQIWQRFSESFTNSDMLEFIDDTAEDIDLGRPTTRELAIFTKAPVKLIHKGSYFPHP